ncbi:MAG: hypothetical protein M5U01_07945 [Ardenticatenaceae bacterium]|nr:hypothetical protein [Ardenticatenaceae bacterium]HBY94707.1 hypothetical protein [Chloroflexota bacterium]
MLLLAAVLVGAGFWLLARSWRLLDVLRQRYHALHSSRAASLVAITLLAIGVALAGLGCRILALAFVRG